MGRVSMNKKCNIISMRISDADKVTLERIMDVTHKSVSDIMRDAMELLKAVPFEAAGMAGSRSER